MNTLTLFRSCLKTQVLFLVNFWKTSRQQRKIPPLKKKESGKNKKGQAASPISPIMGVSRTVIRPLYRILGESKTKIPDSSDFIQADGTDSIGNEMESESIIISLTDNEEVDLSTEEVPLEYSSVATGVSIEEIERMNKAVDNVEVCSSDECKMAQKTIEKLQGTKVFESQSTAFSTKLGKLLDRCVDMENEKSTNGADLSEVDKWFNK